MCARESADDFLAVLGEQLDRDGVAHGAGGDEQGGLFAGDLGGALLQPVDGGVFAVDVVADLGASIMARRISRGGLGDGVAAQIDHAARNSWKTSLESSTPRSVSRRCRRAVSSRPVVEEAVDGLVEARHSSGVGRMPADSRRPTKRRSSERGAGPAAGSRGCSRYSCGDSGFACRRCAVEGMGVGAEADVGLELPVLQVVERFACPGGRNWRSRSGGCPIAASRSTAVS